MSLLPVVCPFRREVNESVARVGPFKRRELNESVARFVSVQM